LLLLAVLSAIAIGFVLLFAVRVSSITSVEAQVDRAASLAGLMRLSIIGLVVVLWRPVVTRLHAADRLYGRPARDWLALRWRVVAWMLLLELLIGRNLVGQLIAMFATGSR
jgi:hypothetical protein